MCVYMYKHVNMCMGTMGAMGPMGPRFRPHPTAHGPRPIQNCL